jgi:DNA-binding transcriptional MerR regulator
MSALTPDEDVDGIGTCAIGEDVAAIPITHPLTVSEVAERVGLSTHTLRWYERIGLLDHVGRDTSGYRRYTARDVEWLLLLIRLRATGMPIKEMRQYAELVRAGQHTEGERRELLQAHRERVSTHIEELQRHLAVIDHKVGAHRRNERRAAQPGQQPPHVTEAASGCRAQPMHDAD